MQMLVYLGKGLREPVAPYRSVVVYGAELNTPNASNWNAPPQIVDPLTVLDLSTLTPNHEAIVALCNLADITSATNIIFRWVRQRDGAVLYTFTFQIPDPKLSGYDYWAWYYGYSYIGYVAWEIAENGSYRVEMSAGGQTQTLPFSVTGIPAPPTTPTTTWPWPLDAVQPWFEAFWNQIQAWFAAVAGWVYDHIKPLFDTVYGWLEAVKSYLDEQILARVLYVWDWLQSVQQYITTNISLQINQVWSWLQNSTLTLIYSISSSINQVWGWLQEGFNSLNQLVLAQFSILSRSLTQFAADIGTRVSAINAWFSQEFIDPFLDWLLQFPGKFWAGLTDWWQGYWRELVRQVKDPTSPLWITWYALAGIAIIGVIAMGAPIGAAVIGAVRWGGGVIASLWPAIGGWLATMVGNLGIWIELYAGALGTWALRLLPRLAGWFLKNLIPLMGAGGIIGLEATGQLNTIISSYVTPAITSVFDWAESIGPVSPQPGRSMSVGITKLAEFTISGLAAMTLAGEFLSPLKHVGLGHISAVLYDLINYKTLTAAFMGVLAFVYIKQPLTYYYQKIARPVLPDERQLAIMAEQRVITPGEYRENMQWQGLPDVWINKLADTVYRPMTPFLLRSLAEAGLLDDALLDHALKQAGYDDISIPYIKQMMSRLATQALQSVFSGAAMTRYKTGLDDANMLIHNLSALGVSDDVMARFVFAAELQYNTDYQTDLIAYYADAYHRRDIEEPELRSSLVASGLVPERLDLEVQRQKIKRLAAPKAVEPPELAIQIDTIRDRRKKELITRQQELEQLIKMGKEMPYAIAIADNDDVYITEVKKPKPAVVVPAYETDEGKIKVDTIRRLRRSRQISAKDELAALLALAVPQSMAQAIVDNDELRLRKETAAE